MFGYKTNGIAKWWRKFRNEERHSSNSPPGSMKAKKQRRIRWTGHVACVKKIVDICKGIGAGY
jgi:hypothetical protein